MRRSQVQALSGPLNKPKSEMERYVIIKHIKNHVTGIKVPVILVDSQSEIMEFESKEEAEKVRDMFQANSDSGYNYEIKRIV